MSSEARKSSKAGRDIDLETGRTVIDSFLDTLWMERGLSDNTLQAYRSDLYAYNAWLVRRGLSIYTAGATDLLAYMAQQGTVSVRTSARRLSSLRRLYQHLAREGKVASDPSAIIEAPRLGRSLPKSLTEAEVEQLLDATCSACRLQHRGVVPMRTL